MANRINKVKQLRLKTHDKDLKAGTRLVHKYIHIYTYTYSNMYTHLLESNGLSFK